MKTPALVFALVLCTASYQYAGAAGVSKCYFCENACDDPMKEMDCPSSIPGGDSIDWICMSLEGTINGNSGVTKTCTQNTDDNIQGCKTSDKLKDVECYTCDSDLCNSSVVYTVSATLIASLILVLTL